MSTAIMIDGAFFIKRIRAIKPNIAHDPKEVAKSIQTLALRHLTETLNKNDEKDKKITIQHDLHRIFFYDCPPFTKRLHHPLTKDIDFSKTDEAVFRTDLHEELRKMRKVALRLGRLADTDNNHWAIKPDVVTKLLKNQKKFDDLTEADIMLNTRQKGVDMRIGIDISALALKKHVDQIVLFAGDSDFVPAAKLARREGIDFILDPMWQSIAHDLNEHIDGLHSTCDRPQHLKPKKPQETN